MRIIGGQFRGLHLASVGAGDANAHLRPTSDRVRESIFNLLINGGYGDPLTGANVLDLFAGTGALGLEALSRGAETLTLVDSGSKARALIQRNIELCRASDRATFLSRDATRLGLHSGSRFSLIFMDPPYKKDLGARTLEAVVKGGWLAPDPLIVWEEGQKQQAPDGFELLDARRYGDTWVHILTGSGGEG